MEYEEQANSHCFASSIGRFDRPAHISKSTGVKEMSSSEDLLSDIIPFAGSGLLGYAMGFALKKILKWMLIIVGFLAGMFFVGVQLLHKYSYVGAVNWDKLGNDTSTQIQHWAANVDVITWPVSHAWNPC